MTTPYARIAVDPRDHTGQTYFILPQRLGFELLTQQQADQIADALNQAYDAGRAHLQSQLRELIGKETDE